MIYPFEAAMVSLEMMILLKILPNNKWIAKGSPTQDIYSLKKSVLEV